MLLNTSENLNSRLSYDKKEKQREQMAAWVEQQTKNSIFLEDEKTNPANALARIGKAMLAGELEGKLKKLNSSLHFEYNSFNSTKKMIYLVDRRGKTPLFPYEAGVMPERSIMNTKEEMVPVEDIYESTTFKMNRKDLGKQTWDEKKQEFVSDTPNPYLRKVLIPWSEKTRGWRTILIKLVIAGAITPKQAEDTFGSHNTREWQNSLGKAKHNLPW